MPFLVRKLNKRDLLEQLVDNERIEDVDADIPTGEFRTTKGTLSTWFINSLDDLDNAILAIAVTSSRISRMDFIIIDTEILKSNDLDYKQTYAGREIPIPDLQELHYDIVDISFKKLYNCAAVYKTILEGEPDDGENYVIRIPQCEIKEKLKQAIKDKRVVKENAEGHILEEIEKLAIA